MDVPTPGYTIHTFQQTDEDEEAKLIAKKELVRLQGLKRTKQEQDKRQIYYTPATSHSPPIIPYTEVISDYFFDFLVQVGPMIEAHGAIVLDRYTPDSLLPSSNDVDYPNFVWHSVELVNIKNEVGEDAYLERRIIANTEDRGPLELFRAQKSIGEEAMKSGLHMGPLSDHAENSPYRGDRRFTQLKREVLEEIPRSSLKSVSLQTLQNLEGNLLKDVELERPGITRDGFSIVTQNDFRGLAMDVLPVLDYQSRGGPTTWIFTPSRFQDKLERALRDLLQEDRSDLCRQWVRHKNILLFKQQLQRMDIPFKEHVQHPGQLVIISQNAYNQYENSRLEESIHISIQYAPNRAKKDRLNIVNAQHSCGATSCPETRFSFSLLQSDSLPNAKVGRKPDMEFVEN